jgi:hypothetical protein
MIKEEKVITTGLALPPAMGLQAALYCDRCTNGWGLKGWRDHWGQVNVLGLDVGPVRLRLVLERLRPGATTKWGLL